MNWQLGRDLFPEVGLILIELQVRQQYYSGIFIKAIKSYILIWASV